MGDRSGRRPAVFVTDGGQRKAIPIVRALGRRGIDVVVGESHRWPAARWSRFVRRSHRYPSPLESPEEFVDWLDQHLSQHSYDALIPLDERTMGPITGSLDRLSAHTVIPVVDGERYAIARDKARTLELARAADVPHPRTEILTDLPKAEALSGIWEYPAVLKPRISQGSRGIRYVSSAAAMLSAYREIHEEYPRPLLQEKIPRGGDTFGVEVLMNRESEPRAVFVHRRLREYPVSGGPSTLRESVSRPDLVDMAVRLLRAARWYGVAMVEFMTDPRDGSPKLMEINAKFWGSICLPIAAGVDFPYLLFRLAMEGDVATHEGYPAGVEARWLLPGDVLHFIANPDRLRLEPSFFRFFGKNLHYDLLSLTDPLPPFALLAQYLSMMTRSSVRADLRRGR